MPVHACSDSKRRKGNTGEAFYVTCNWWHSLPTAVAPVSSTRFPSSHAATSAAASQQGSPEQQCMEALSRRTLEHDRLVVVQQLLPLDLRMPEADLQGEVKNESSAAAKDHANKTMCSACSRQASKQSNRRQPPPKHAAANRVACCARRLLSPISSSPVPPDRPQSPTPALHRRRCFCPRRCCRRQHCPRRRCCRRRLLCHRSRCRPPG